MLVLLCGAAPFVGESSATQPPGDAVADPNADALLVTYGASSPTATRRSRAEAAGAKSFAPIAGTQVAVVGVDPGERSEVASALESMSGVVAVEVDQPRRAFDSVPSDPDWSKQAQAMNLIRAPRAWDRTRGDRSTVVAVLDTGIDLDHPDLAPNIAKAETVLAGSPADDNGHGTNVAGIIGAVDSNGKGVTGVAPDVRLHSIKVLDAAGMGSDSNVITGIQRAIAGGADVINMSLGGSTPSIALESAVNNALAAGIVVVAAAGNEGHTGRQYPAAYPGVLGVTATTLAGEATDFTSYGAWVSLSAPGSGVYTTTRSVGAASTYGEAYGSSFAAPFVAGVAALVKDRLPGASSSRVVAQLTRTAYDRGAPGFDWSYGFGVVDAAAAVEELPPRRSANPGGDANGTIDDATVVSGSSATDAISPELDEDWFAFDVATGHVDFAVTPNLIEDDIQASFDAALELYDASHRQLKRTYATGSSSTRHIAADLAAQRVYLRVMNGNASQWSAGYSISLTNTTYDESDLAEYVDYDPELSGVADSIVNADVDGDGRDDLVWSDTARDSVFVLPQASTGMFTNATAQELSATTEVWVDGVAVGDFDDDADNDIALATAAGLEIFWQTDAGWTDATVALAPPAAGAYHVLATGDADGAGGDDLAAVGPSVGATLLTYADGVWSTETVTDLGARDVALHDMDDDGTSEVVVLSSSVEVHARAGDGWSSSITALASLAPSMDVGDVTGDGRDDVAVSLPYSPTGHQVGLLAQDANGNLESPLLLATHVTPQPVTIADIDGDELLDIVVVHTGSGASRVGVYLGNGSGVDAEELSPIIPYIGTYDTNAVASGDFDGDGLNDVAVAGRNVGALVLRHATAERATAYGGSWIRDTVPTSNATGVSTTAPLVIALGAPASPATVTSSTVQLLDGRTNAVHPATIAYDDALNRITVTPATPLGRDRPYRLVTTDGLRDANGWHTDQLSVGFITATAARVAPSVGTGQTASRGDFNGDGFDDIHWKSSASSSLSLGGPRGLSTSQPAAALPSDTRPAAGDFNGDGYTDLLVYRPGTGNDVVHRGGPSGFTTVDISNVSATFSPLTGDFNADGYDDVLWYAAGSAPDAIWYGGPWTLSSTHRASLTINGTYRPTVADYDGDGDDDVFWYRAGTATDLMWRGGASGFTTKSFTVTSTYTPTSGDFNGNGFDDVFWYGVGTASDRLWSFTTGLAFASAAIAAGGAYVPSAGDFDGDGYDDIYWYSPTSTDATWWGSPTGPK